MNPDNDILMHYGMPRRSGRYPWGSGDNPYQHGQDFLSRIDELKKIGWAETPENIKNEFGLTTTQYRTEKALARSERRLLDVARAKSLAEDGLGATEIGRQMGINESTVRSLLNEKAEAKTKQAQKTADSLKLLVDEKGMIDVGTGVERELNISKERLNEALYILEREGYPVYKGGIPQVTNPGKQINQRVLCPPGTEHKEIYNFENVHSVKDYYSDDGGDTFRKIEYPKSMDSSRLKIRYADEAGPDGITGLQKDGIIELRRGVDDLSLDGSRYSQVRILVDNDRYLKGMAVYSDNMPDGVDVVFNTNKTSDKPMRDVLKKIKEDPDNPFGSAIKRQSTYIDKDGNKQLSLINKRADEGDWSDWSNALPSQFLSKQSRTLAKRQLDLAKIDKQQEYDEIMSLTNPTIKKHLLEDFANNCDAAAVNLKAASLPGQKYHVIIPINTLKDTEVYAPNYADGTQLALIRYPHGGTFEIPILTVNNKNPLANKILGKDVGDAVGITSKVAERLSGADFDGDTVMCIPTNDGKTKITSTKSLKGLEGFDPKLEYGGEAKIGPDGKTHYYRNGQEYRKMTNTQNEMGVISNLITDMTLAGATPDKLARAVRHSMVVIDAEKHGLDYKASEIDNNIAALKREYQRHVDSNGNVRYGGASTLISRSSSQTSVLKRQGSPKVNAKGKDWYDPTKPEGALIYNKSDDLYYPDRSYDKKTGNVTIRTSDGKKVTYNVADKEASDKYNPVKRVDETTGKVTYTNKDGSISYKVNTRMEKSTKMAETNDAYSLVSEGRHPMELIYADYANSMKSLANQARLSMINTEGLKYNRQASEVYKNEVSSLNTKLNTALLNATREREAQRRANAEINAKKLANPNMKKDDLKKISQKALSNSRSDVGSISRRDRNIEITDREWEAIQAGAISENKLIQILNNADSDKLRQRATPRASTELSTAKVNRIKALAANDVSLGEIANKLGISTSVVSKYLKGNGN
jgi:DNA-binding CsgD family transcriptional regulator